MNRHRREQIGNRPFPSGTWRVPRRQTPEAPLRLCSHPLLLLAVSVAVTGAGVSHPVPDMGNKPPCNHAAGCMRRMCLRGGAPPGDVKPPAPTAPAVTAYEVKGRVDYDRLIRDWGSQVLALLVHVNLSLSESRWL